MATLDPCNKSKQTQLETTINPSGGHSYNLGGDGDEVYDDDHLETMQGSRTVSPSVTERWRGADVNDGGIRVSLTCN